MWNIPFNKTVWIITSPTKGIIPRMPHWTPHWTPHIFSTRMVGFNRFSLGKRSRNDVKLHKWVLLQMVKKSCVAIPNGRSRWNVSDLAAPWQTIGEYFIYFDLLSVFYRSFNAVLRMLEMMWHAQRDTNTMVYPSVASKSGLPHGRNGVFTGILSAINGGLPEV